MFVCQSVTPAHMHILTHSLVRVLAVPFQHDLQPLSGRVSAHMIIAHQLLPYVHSWVLEQGPQLCLFSFKVSRIIRHHCTCQVNDPDPVLYRVVHELPKAHIAM